MLVIRKEQMEALSKQRLQQFEDRLVQYLTETMPDQCAARGEDQLRQDIRHGIERAVSYDITGERDVAGYVELLVRLGRDFDQRAETSWVQAILSDRMSTAENRLRRVQWRLTELRGETR